MGRHEFLLAVGTGCIAYTVSSFMLVLFASVFEATINSYPYVPLLLMALITTFSFWIAYLWMVGLEKNEIHGRTIGIVTIVFAITQFSPYLGGLIVGRFQTFDKAVFGLSVVCALLVGYIFARVRARRRSV